MWISGESKNRDMKKNNDKKREDKENKLASRW